MPCCQLPVQASTATVSMSVPRICGWDSSSSPHNVPSTASFSTTSTRSSPSLAETEEMRSAGGISVGCCQLMGRSWKHTVVSDRTISSPFTSSRTSVFDTARPFDDAHCYQLPRGPLSPPHGSPAFSGPRSRRGRRRAVVSSLRWKYKLTASTCAWFRNSSVLR